MKPNVIIIGDFLKDLDDEHALVLATALDEMGKIKLRCVIGNLAPAEMRARGAKATLEQLGLPDIPVGVGLPVFEGKVHPYEADLPYLVPPESVVADGHALLVETLHGCDDGSVILVLQSGLTDAAKLLREQEVLCCQKLSQVAIMGGVEVENESAKLVDGFLVPNNANNNTFDWDAALWLYRRLQELGIPMVVTTREAAYAVQLPVSTYDALATGNHPVALCLKTRQLRSYQKLWEAACSELGSAIRGTLPSDRDRAWFVKVFCGGSDPGITDGADICPFIQGFNLYDPINLLAAIPEFRRIYFSALPVRVGETPHYVIGLTASQNGIPDARAIREILVGTEVFIFGHCQLLSMTWRLEGEDEFSNEVYPLPGFYFTEEQARSAAQARLKELEQSQPSASSGGQSHNGIQDCVYLVDPKGNRTRITQIIE